MTTPYRPPLRPLVLASTSRYRRALLRAAGVDVQAVAPRYDERPTPGLSARALVAHHAREKARSVAAEHPGALIVGSDQGVVLDGALLGKPGTRERAVAQLCRLAGREHALVTCVALLDATTGALVEATCEHQMRMRALSRREIEAYVARDLPVDCAGAYKVEGAGAALFTAMRGDDHTGIVGLPITTLVTLLTALGDDWWARVGSLAPDGDRGMVKGA